MFNQVRGSPAKSNGTRPPFGAPPSGSRSAIPSMAPPARPPPKKGIPLGQAGYANFSVEPQQSNYFRNQFKNQAPTPVPNFSNNTPDAPRRKKKRNKKKLVADVVLSPSGSNRRLHQGKAPVPPPSPFIKPPTRQKKTSSFEDAFKHKERRRKQKGSPMKQKKSSYSESDANSNNMSYTTYFQPSPASGARQAQFPVEQKRRRRRKKKLNKFSDSRSKDSSQGPKPPQQSSFLARGRENHFQNPQGAVSFLGNGAQERGIAKPPPLFANKKGDFPPLPPPRRSDENKPRMREKSLGLQRMVQKKFGGDVRIAKKTPPPLPDKRMKPPTSVVFAAESQKMQRGRTNAPPGLGWSRFMSHV